MSEEEPQDVQPIQYPGLNEAVAAAVAQALANAGSLQPLGAPPAGPALFMTSTPILGLKQPALDDPALITDLNDNFTILDNSITATGAATLTNKTLTSPVITNPTITGWTNAQHNHLNPAGAGLLDGAAIGSGYLGTGNLLRETALTDGSFSGMKLTAPTLLDPIVRTTLWWGPTGTGTPDVSLARAAANSLVFAGDIGLTRISSGHVRVSGIGAGSNAPAVSVRSTFAGTTTSGRLMASGDNAELAWNVRLDAAGVWMREDITKKSALLVQEGNAALIVYGTDKGPTPSLPDDPIAWRAYLNIDYNGTTKAIPLPGFAGMQVEGTQAFYDAKTISATGAARFGQADSTLAAFVSVNAKYDGTNWLRDDVSKTALHISLASTPALSEFAVYNAPVAANPITWVKRVSIPANGGFTVTPDANIPGLLVTGALPGTNEVVVKNTAPSGNDIARLALRSGPAEETLAFLEADHLGALIGANNVALRVQTASGFTLWTNNAQRLWVLPDRAAVGVGVSPAAWHTSFPVIQLGGGAALWGNGGAAGLWLTSNSVYDGSRKALFGGTIGMEVTLGGSGMQVLQYPAVAAGAVQSPLTRFSLNPNGTLTLAPDNSVMALNCLMNGSGGAQTVSIDMAANGYARFAHSAYLQVASGTGYVQPQADNTHYLGSAGARWNTVYAVVGAINTSVYEAKEDFAPLDPGACTQAVLETDWVAFSYKPPAYVDLEIPTHDDTPKGKQRQADESRKAHAKALVETAPTRAQKGYVLQSPDHKVHDLFGLSDRKSASPSSDLAVVACALQNALLRIEALEVQVAGAA